MSKRAELADKQVDELIAKATKLWHTDLLDAGAVVKAISIYPELDDAGRPKSPAIKHGGAPAAAQIKVASVRERVIGNCDAIMEIDGYRWNSLDDGSRMALIDHELEHLVVTVDKSGAPQRHDDGRPKLSTKPDDWSLTGFVDVVKRHGAKALEAMAIKSVAEQCQELMPFMREAAAAA